MASGFIMVLLFMYRLKYCKLDAVNCIDPIVFITTFISVPFEYFHAKRAAMSILFGVCAFFSVLLPHSFLCVYVRVPVCVSVCSLQKLVSTISTICRSIFGKHANILLITSSVFSLRRIYVVYNA